MFDYKTQTSKYSKKELVFTVLCAYAREPFFCSNPCVRMCGNPFGRFPFGAFRGLFAPGPSPRALKPVGPCRVTPSCTCAYVCGRACM